MIEVLGVKLTYEGVAFLLAFVASEVIGSSKLRENSVAQLVKTLIDNLKPMRQEDEKVAQIKAKIEELTSELKQLGE